MQSSELKSAGNIRLAYPAGRYQKGDQVECFEPIESSQGSGGRHTITNVAEVSASDAGETTALMTAHEAPTGSDLRSSERYQTVTVRTIQNLTCASPFSNTSFNQSNGIFGQRVFDKSERDLINITTTNGPKRGILAATCDPCVQTTVTEAAVTAGKLDGAASFTIAATTGGETWKRRKARKAPKAWQDEEVEDEQHINRDDQITNHALTKRESR